MTAGRTIKSQSVRWCTPPKYVDAVVRVLGSPIALDPCSDKLSIVPAETAYLLPQANGLRKSWDFRTIYVNPPYGVDRKRGSSIRDWLRRCRDAHTEHAAEVLALVPVAANTRHWKESVWGQAAAVCFLYDTRLRFLEEGKAQAKGAPMACAMIYWGENVDRFVDVFTEFGAAIDIRDLQGKALGDCESGLPKVFCQA